MTPLARDSCMRGETLSVVVPVYGGGGTIAGVVQRVIDVLDRTALSGELVLVDASPDNAWEVLQQLQAAYPERIQIMQLMRNFGQHNALMCGLRHARGKYIVTMDDDGQHPPEEIPRLVEAMEKTGADVVYGVPRNRRHAWWRNLGAWAVVRFFQIALRTPVVPSALRILRREVVDAITQYPYHFTHIDGLIVWNTTRIGQVLVEHRPRASGRSGYSLSKLLLLAVNVFTNFSLLPLQVATVVGILAAVGGLTLGLAYLLLYLLGHIAVPGYASTIVAVLVLGGLQLLALGIIGEYLGRVHLNLNKRPQYTVRQVRSAAAHESGPAVEPLATSSAEQPAGKERDGDS